MKNKGYNSTFTMGKVEDSIVARAMRDVAENLSSMQSKYYAKNIDRYLFLHIRTKPKYIPTKLWHYILSKILMIQCFDFSLSLSDKEAIKYDRDSWAGRGKF